MRAWLEPRDEKTKRFISSRATRRGARHEGIKVLRYDAGQGETKDLNSIK